MPHVTRTWPRWTLALSLLLGACGLLWAGESARLGGCTPRAPRTDEGPMDVPLVHAPSDPNAEREVTGAVARLPPRLTQAERPSARAMTRKNERE